MARPRSPEGGCESQGDSRLPEVPRHLLAPRPVSPPFAGPPGLCSVVKPRGVQAHGLEHFSTSGEMKRLVADPSLIVASPCLVFLGLLATLPSPGGGGGVCMSACSLPSSPEGQLQGRQGHLTSILFRAFSLHLQVLGWCWKDG